MSVIKRILNTLSLLCLLGGIFLIIYSYLTNRTFISYISKLLSDAEFGATMKNMLIGLGLIVLALILFIIGLRIGSKIRKNVKERLAQEKAAREEQEKAQKEMQAEMESIKIEAEKARADAEEARNQLKALESPAEEVEVEVIHPEETNEE